MPAMSHVSHYTTMAVYIDPTLLQITIPQKWQSAALNYYVIAIMC